MDASKMKVVYIIKTRGQRTFWNRIGVAFVNRDGSLNVKLDAVPVDGDLHIRDYSPKEDLGDVSLSHSAATSSPGESFDSFSGPTPGDNGTHDSSIPPF